VYPACDQELPSAGPLVALIFEPIRATAGGKEPQLSVRRSLIAAVAPLGDTGGAAWRLACDPDIG